jgi:hypothetical protein
MRKEQQRKLQQRQAWLWTALLAGQHAARTVQPRAMQEAQEAQNWWIDRCADLEQKDRRSQSVMGNATTATTATIHEPQHS